MLWQKKSLGSIVESFTRSINDLDELFATNANEVKSNEALVERLNQASNQLTTENTRVEKIASNLRQLIAE